MAEHKLEREWTIWFSSRVKKQPPAKSSPGRQKTGAPSPANADDAFTPPKLVNAFNTIDSYWRSMNSIPVPSKLLVDFNIFLFQRSTEPKWEHKDNIKGGRWTFAVANTNPKAADALWLNAHLALVGETLDPGFEIVGIALAHRRDYTRVSVWTKNREDKTTNMAIGKLFMEITQAHKLEYQDHGEAFKSYRYVL